MPTCQTLYRYYPGVIERLVIVNPPFGASAIISILLPTLPAFLRDKVSPFADGQGTGREEEEDIF